ncbi:MAG: sigma-54-dependent transcriptional regulator [Planctomycetota bacterium]
MVCTSCDRILSAEGHQVKTTQDPREGLRIAEETNPDIAVVDLKMPGVDGLEFLSRIKEISPWTDVMIITGFAEIETAVKAMRLGAVDYIPKPFSPDQLLISIAKVLERKRLQSENAYLRQELQTRYRFESIIGSSRQMQEVYNLIERVAPTHSTVLIRGESGTGKELIARAIHFNSLRRSERFVAVDCGALSETILESEMFGHVKGAFTGAVTSRKGFFETADGGTLFLDEVGNISLAVQTRLLRVLQEREFKPVGASEIVKTDIRLIAATNKDLEKLVAKGEFREELYYRLNIVPIVVPPLRERQEDVPELAMHFLKKHRSGTGSQAAMIDQAAMDLLMQYSWPGNVRELENAVQRAMVLATGDRICSEHFPPGVRFGTSQVRISVPGTWAELRDIKKALREESVQDVERMFVLDALARNGGNATKAAKAVGMLRTNFQALMKRHGVTREGLPSAQDANSPREEV